MKRLFYFFAVSALVMSMQGCSQDSVTGLESKVLLKLTGSINQTTRVNASGFEANDNVGVYVSSTGTLAISGNTLDNEAFTYSSGNITAPAGKEVYWDSEDARLSVFAYYPYSENVSSVTAYPFSVAIDQSVETDFYDSDFITAQVTNIAPQTTPVNLAFSHSLSRINVSLQAGDGITADELAAAEKSLSFVGLVADGTIDLTTGIATAGSTKTTITALESNGVNYSAIVYPQDGAVTFCLEMEGNVYTYTTDVEFSAGYQSQFNLTLNTWESPEMTLTATMINPWEDGDETNGSFSNALYFPDPIFSDFLLNAEKSTDESFQETSDKIDANGDGKISKEEAEAVIYLDASKGQEILKESFTDITGIEYFVNLQAVNFDSHTSLSSVDVSKNTKLQLLKVSACPISSIDVSKNTDLEYLYCYNCGLTVLDLSNNTKLKYVDCAGNLNLETIYIADGVNYQYWSIQSGVTPSVKTN